MAVATGDLLQITDYQEYLGEEMLNVYYYRWFSAPSIDNSVYPPLLSSFILKVVDPVLEVQNGGVEHTKLQIKNLSNAVDFYELPVNAFGQFPGAEAEYEPSYVTVGFKLIRDSLVTRNGYKRYSGLVNAQVSGNDYLDSGAVETNIEAGLADLLTVGLIDVAAPIIVKRPIPEPAGTSYLYSSITSAQLVGLGTQNTRKAGQGI